MVQLVEVEDEHFQQPQPGVEEDEGDYTDTDSEISNDSDYDPSEESLADRLYALKDMIPPTVRGWVSGKVQTTSRVLRTGLFFVGRSTWTIAVSAMLVGIPFALCWAEEQNMVAMEQEARMREMGSEMLTGGESKEGDTAAQVGAALGGGAAAARPAL